MVMMFKTLMIKTPMIKIPMIKIPMIKTPMIKTPMIKRPMIKKEHIIVIIPKKIKALLVYYCSLNAIIKETFLKFVNQKLI